MKHVGDITKLSGYDIPVVDVITGGSPCQDLSVAGQRAGLAGERSGLFMEQIRVVKEMREHDRATGRAGWMVRPRYMVWENVPGAFSSSGGKDFQAVLEEIVGIVEEHVPDLSDAVKGGWTKSGCVYDEMGAWSVAWRVHDAQFWGVPQRRKRIALVADFGGLSAPDILFERKGLHGTHEEVRAVAEGMSGDLEPRGAEGKKTSAGVETGFGETGKGYLTQATDMPQWTSYGISSYESNAMKSSNPNSGVYKTDTSRTLDLNGGSPACNQGGVAIVGTSGPKLMCAAVDCRNGMEWKIHE